MVAGGAGAEAGLRGFAAEGVAGVGRGAGGDGFAEDARARGGRGEGDEGGWWGDGGVGRGGWWAGRWGEGGWWAGTHGGGEVAAAALGEVAGLEDCVEGGGLGLEGCLGGEGVAGGFGDGRAVGGDCEDADVALEDAGVGDVSCGLDLGGGVVVHCDGLLCSLLGVAMRCPALLDAFVGSGCRLGLANGQGSWNKYLFFQLDCNSNREEHFGGGHGC